MSKANLIFYSSPLDAGLTVDTADSRKNLVETIHGLDFKLFVPKIKKGQTYHFYLLFPSTANKTADFVANSLRASSNQVKIYSSQTEGAWDFFVKDPSVDIGSVLIHESVVVSISEVSNSLRGCGIFRTDSQALQH
jgi:1,4-alpha-glucan branching enzyme